MARREIWNKRKNGEIYPEWLTIVKIDDEMTGEVFITPASFQILPSASLHEARIKALAFYDELTEASEPTPVC